MDPVPKWCGSCACQVAGSCQWSQNMVFQHSYRPLGTLVLTLHFAAVSSDEGCVTLCEVQRRACQSNSTHAQIPQPRLRGLKSRAFATPEYRCWLLSVLQLIPISRTRWICMFMEGVKGVANPEVDVFHLEVVPLSSRGQMVIPSWTQMSI